MDPAAEHGVLDPFHDANSLLIEGVRSPVLGVALFHSLSGTIHEALLALSEDLGGNPRTAGREVVAVVEARDDVSVDSS